MKLVSERYSTTRSLAGIKVAHPKREKAPATAEQPAAPQVSVPWELLSPIEVRFANLLYRNPTLLDRAAEYFDMDFAASGIQIFDSPLIDEFIQSILAQYAETGAFSPRTLYESLSPQLQLFLEQLPDETWKTPNEILEFYDTLAVLTLNLCDRYKKLIPLDSEAGMRLRMQLNKFTQGIQTISKKRKISAITPDVFAEQIIQSKTPLIELYTEINELAMNGGNAAQFNNAQFSPQAPTQFAAPTPAQPSSPQYAAPQAATAPTAVQFAAPAAQSTTAQFNNTQFAIPQATTAAQPSSPQYAAPAVQSAFQQPEMPPEMEAPPPFESDEQFASSEPPEDVPYDPNEDEPYVPDDDFGAMDDFG